MKNNPTLTICIPTVIGRERQFNALVAEIERQAQGYAVDILSCCDSKEMTIGAKRELMYKEAQGEYCLMIDDDDEIVSDFIPVIFKYLQDRPDCVTYLERVIENGIERISCHSNRFKEWASHVEGYHYVRTPYFKDVIKTEICKAIPVPDVRYGEDHKWSDALKASGLIKTEAHIPRIMYYYTMNNLTVKQHKERYGIKQ